MAWSKTLKAPLRTIATETCTLPASATTGYSSVIDFMTPDGNPTRYISVLAVVSAVSGSENIDFALYGAMTPTGSKFLLKDAVVADLTNASKIGGGVVDLNAYPAPYYFIGFLANADESGSTVALSLYY